MPTYNYLCNSCGEEFDRFNSIAERNVPTEEPCPSCGKETVSMKIGAPGLNAEVGGSLKKAGSGWKDVLGKIKDTYKINNIRD